MRVFWGKTVLGQRKREQLQSHTRLTKGNFEGKEKKNTAHVSQLYIYPLQCIPNVVFLDSPRSFLFFLLPNQSFSHVGFFFIFQAADQLALCLDSYRQRSWQATVIPQNKHPRDAFLFFLNLWRTKLMTNKAPCVWEAINVTKKPRERECV